MEPLGIIVATPDMEIPVETFPFYVATQKGWLVNTPTLFGARPYNLQGPALRLTRSQRILSAQRQEAPAAHPEAVP